VGALLLMLQEVTQEELVATLDKVKSSVGGADLEKFAKWMDEFGAT